MITPLNRPLTDLGGFPVIWDTDTGTLEQDPTQGGTNVYGPGDLFRDAQNGDLYQLGQDGGLAFVRSGSPPTVAGTAQGLATPLPAILGGTSGNAQPPRGAGGAAGGLDVQTGQAAQGTASAIGTFLSSNLTFGTSVDPRTGRSTGGFSLPYWLIAAGAGAFMFHKRRRGR